MKESVAACMRVQCVCEKGRPGRIAAEYQQKGLINEFHGLVHIAFQLPIVRRGDPHLQPKPNAPNQCSGALEQRNALSRELGLGLKGAQLSGRPHLRSFSVRRHQVVCEAATNKQRNSTPCPIPARAGLNEMAHTVGFR